MSVELLDQLHSIAREAGDAIAKLYHSGFDVDYKSPGDPVTSADTLANALIIERLSELAPDVPVVAEESSAEEYTAFSSKERIFFVDPIDGTRDFIKRNGEFVVMIGLVEEEHASLGVVLAPATGEAWLGSTKDGAWKVSADGRRQAIQPSSKATLEDSVMVASRSRSSAAAQRATQLLGVQEVKPLGSAGLKGSWVADGSADLYLSPGVAGMRWDACAIDAIVNAAGGRFSDIAGQAIDYRSADLANRGGLLATNGPLHDLALDRLAELRTQEPG